MEKRRQRGSVAVTVALLLPVLIGFVALGVDLGHVYLVRNQLQNGVDSAALAGARTLDGTAAGLAAARSMAQDYGRKHLADGTPVALQPNGGNAADGDIVLGHWHPEAQPPYFEAALDPTVAPAWINAIQTHSTRASSSGNPVRAFLAQTLGITSFDVGATAIAVGGGPVAECSFPLTIPDCELQPGSSATSLKCGVQISLSFNNDPGDTAGLTNLLAAAPVSTAGIRQLVRDARAGICHKPPGDIIYVGNGTNINPIAQDIRDWLAANGGPVTVNIPVLQTGLNASNCTVRFNQSFPIDGYAKMQILSVSPPGGTTGNRVNVVLLCGQTTEVAAGGGFYGDTAHGVYLTR